MAKSQSALLRGNSGPSAGGAERKFLLPSAESRLYSAPPITRSLRSAVRWRTQTVMDTQPEELEDDVLDMDEDIDKLEQNLGLNQPGFAVKKPRSWRSVEEYAEDRRLRDSLSEFDYDL